MTDWLQEATLSLDKAVNKWRDDTWLEGVLRGEEARVRAACRVAYEQGLINAARMSKEKDA